MNIKYISRLDNNCKFINLTYDFAFKFVMKKNISLFKKFLIYNLDLDDDVYVIDSDELIARVGNKIIIVGMNTSMDNVIKNYLYGYDSDIYYINFDSSYNMEDRVINVRDVDGCEKSIRMFIRYIRYYKDMFLNNKILNFDEVFMVGLNANSYAELYNIMKNILSDDELNVFISSVLNMSNDKDILHKWACEEINKLVIERRDEKKYIDE